MRNGNKEKALACIQRPRVEENRYSGDDYINLASNEAAFGSYKHYPYTFPLYKILSGYFGIDISNITLTRGAEEAISLVYETYADAGDKTIKISPTFGMVEVFEKIHQTCEIDLSYNRDLSVPLDRLRSELHQNPRICYLANPNNITGSMLNWDDLVSLLDDINDTFFILDITYLPYTEEYKNIKELFDFKRFPTLILTVSFSKVYGLAGVRSGCAIASPEIINMLRKTQPMQEINVVAINETIKALKYPDIAHRNISNSSKWKNIFAHEFPDAYIPSKANFILLKTHLASDIFNRLLENKIVTRMEFNHPIMKNIIRISIGTPGIMERVLKIVKKVLC